MKKSSLFSIIGAYIFGYMAAMGFILFDSDTVLEPVMKKLDSIEGALKTQSEKADAEIKALGKASQDTETALENLGVKQRELADELLQIKQKQTAPPADEKKSESWGDQFIKSGNYTESLGRLTSGMKFGNIGFEVKNTLVGSNANVAPARSANIVSGAFQPLTLESFLPSVPTSSNAIEFTRENVFTNNAAEAAEGAQKGESALTWTLVNMPVSTVAHFIKISKQLAADAPALAAYVNTRMAYGVNAKVESQLIVGDGTAPNISGVSDGNFTAHGIADAGLGATLKKMVLIRKVLAASWAAGYPADGILLNPADFAQIEIDLLTTAAGQTLLSYTDGGQPKLWGVPVIQSTGVVADTFYAGAFAQAYMIHNREGVIIELSDSDGDNFQKNLITIRAERRLALATERPAAVRGGDLTPA